MNKYLFVIFSCSAIVIFALFGTDFIDMMNSVNNFVYTIDVNISHHTRLTNETADRWIVITSVSYPTEDIKEMAIYKGWTIVVVGDKKSPKNWSFPNCHFLSVEDQMKLGYEILSLIPFNSYTRKMVGYLFAIENGAKFIYDTDDDNLPIKMKLDSFDYSNLSTCLVYKNQGKSSFFNIYTHYGRPDMWPRGFPLEEINEDVRGTNFHLCSDIPTPTIQQGVANQDPDVDAVYRMIYVKNKTDGLNIEFDDMAPPVVIDHDTYVPFNSQSTLFHYGAFWALLLPTTVTFRVTDIWRGYFAQRLLRLCGQHLAFYGVSCRHARNPHNYYKDFLQETFLRTELSRMVNVFQNWTCPSANFVDCVLSLAETMTKASLWLRDDYLLTKAWLNDLQRVRYSFPDIQRNRFNAEKCLTAGFVSNMRKNTQAFEVQQKSLKTLNHFCNRNINRTNSSYTNLTKLQFSGFSDTVYSHKKNVILVVVYNFPMFGSIPLLQTIYDPWFANVIFCGSFPNNLDSAIFNGTVLPFNRKYSYVNLTSSDLKRGYFGYLCLTKAAKMGIRGADGYLVISDDMLLNFWNPFNVTEIHSHVECNSTEDVKANEGRFRWWSGPFGKPALKNLLTSLNKTTTVRYELKAKLESIAMHPVVCSSDIYYIPQRLVQDYVQLSQLFFENKVFLEIAVPKILMTLGWSISKGNNTANVDLVGKYLWSKADRSRHRFSSYNKTFLFLHPVKLSRLNNRLVRKGFCLTYISSLFETVSNRNE